MAHFRAIQGRFPTDPELMRYVLIPYNWKSYIYHRGCSFNVDKRRQTIFFTPLNPFGGDPEKRRRTRDDYTVPQKVHYHSHWKRDQDAVYWVIIPSTRSVIAILANKVTCDHLERSRANRVHLQSNLSVRRSNIVRKTLKTTTRAKSHTEKQLAIAAAAAVY